MRPARDFWSAAMLKGENLTDRHIVIADERGEQLFMVRFTEALPKGLRRRSPDA